MKTDKEKTDLELLDEAIKKYERIKEIFKGAVGKKLHGETANNSLFQVGNKYFGIRSNKCGLCQKYIACYKCPIGVRSTYGCGATPWMELSNLLLDNQNTILTSQLIRVITKVVQLEITFLKKVKKGVKKLAQ